MGKDPGKISLVRLAPREWFRREGILHNTLKAPGRLYTLLTFLKTVRADIVRSMNDMDMAKM